MSGSRTGVGSSEASGAAAPAPARGAAQRGLAVGAGLLLGLVGAGWIGLGSAQLPTVFLTQDVVTKGAAPSVSWAVLAVLTATAVGLLTTPAARVRRVDVVALVGAAWLVGCTAVLAWIGPQFEFTGPESFCRHDSCWPAGWQELAVMTPLLLTALLMVVGAAVGRRLPWRVRAAVPAVTFIGLTVVQVAVWDGVVLPVLDGPPPF